ncbi:MAG: 16S rRNA (guanine(527)-N(7))-methyltransferase RsmG [Actinobacteria bacterium]|nr:16S rRNA (guanine(527)-N(7))-methyltransferase RsmG [Actinomycetota bacterium]
MTVSRETRANELFGENGAKALRYAELLATTAIERGLIGPKEGERIWERHIENCLPVTSLLPESGTLADVGSGAGLPGIVIALAKPKFKVTLIEPLQRRCEFLYEVIDELRLSIEVIRAKSELVSGEYDFVTARAVAPLARLIDATWHLIRPGGSLLAMKGESAAEEMAVADLKIASKSVLHEIKMADIPVSRVVELVKAG